MKSMVLTAIACLGLASGCASMLAQEHDSVPSSEVLVEGPVLSGWPQNLVSIDVQDFRSDRANSTELVAVVRSSILRALSAPSVKSGPQYKLKVMVIEHRSHFTLGHWNGLTKFRATVQDHQGKTLKQWVALGENHRSNMWGLADAEAASSQAFKSAVSDLLGQMNMEPIHSD